MASTGTSPSKLSNLSSWKGKAKATEDDYDDLNPIITYRHLHSHNLGVKDPLRVIALCDSDAFYAACEQVRLGADPSEPLVVQQWDSLIAINYPARKYGISRMDKAKDAKKRCPHLRLVHVATYKEGEKEPGYWENPDSLTHKVSLDHYRRESMKIIQLFKDGLPGGEIERASIDEAFIDFTRPVREEILKRYPYLAQVPHDAPEGKDTPLPQPPPIIWEDRSTVIPITPPPPDITAAEDEETKETAAKVQDEEGMEADESCTWHDIALSIAAEYMAKIRQDIYTTLGYTTSAGIGRNKFLAKLTASYKKPNSQSILRNAAIPNYLRPMAFQKIRFLGGKLGKALAEEYDVSAVGDILCNHYVLIRSCGEEMQRKFGEDSIWVYEILRGIDRSEVKEKPSVTKSMLASKNLPQPIVKTSQGKHWIRVLAAELALRLREARETVPALWPKSIVLHVRQGYETSRSKQAPFPFSRDITVDLIASAGDKLWKELVGTNDERTTPFKITNVQLSFLGINSMEIGQRNIEGFFPTGVHPVPAIGTADSPKKLKRKRTTDSDEDGAEADDADAILSPNQLGPDQDQAARDGLTVTSEPDPAGGARSSSSNPSSFVCGRCKKRVALPAGLAGVEDVDIKRDAMTALQQEHNDWHFAQDLSRQPSTDQPRLAIRPQSESVKSGVNERSAVTGKKKPKEKESKSDEGIAKFFTVTFICFRMLWRAATKSKSTKLSRFMPEHVFFRTQLGVYVASLLVSNAISCAGYVANVNWLRDDAVASGILCTAQGALTQVGDLATAYFTAAIAVHTFCTLTLRNRLPKFWAWIAVFAGWVFTIISAVAPAFSHLAAGPIYGSDGAACGFSQHYPVVQLLLHLIPVLVASLVASVFYALVFLGIRGTLSIKDGVKFTLDPQARWKEQDGQMEYIKFIAAVANSMLIFPIVYVALLMPHIVVCLVETAGWIAPAGAKVFAFACAGLLGFFNVLILYNTLRIMGPAFNTSGGSQKDVESFSTPEKSPVDVAPSVSAVLAQRAFPRAPTIRSDSRQTSIAGSTTHLMDPRANHMHSSSNGSTSTLASLNRSIIPADELKNMVNVPMTPRITVDGGSSPESDSSHGLSAPRRPAMKRPHLRRPSVPAAIQIPAYPEYRVENGMLSAVNLKTPAQQSAKLSTKKTRDRDSFIAMYAPQSSGSQGVNVQVQGPSPSPRSGNFADRYDMTTFTSPRTAPAPPTARSSSNGSASSPESFSVQPHLADLALSSFAQGLVERAMKSPEHARSRSDIPAVGSTSALAKDAVVRNAKKTKRRSKSLDVIPRRGIPQVVAPGTPLSSRAQELFPPTPPEYAFPATPRTPRTPATAQRSRSPVPCLPSSPRVPLSALPSSSVRRLPRTPTDAPPSAFV
ncbi:hypothetical protein EUX98_g7885 [Antrodiella citrinella]|uniref:DNA polymerase eta n=1 Tax=Antrodiella citrinella TaxID=2447956 RepID=A0A4S4MKE8_9APHY|nr:hypothetical protein EUX98_g7885 [Antrodiella citrinella]